LRAKESNLLNFAEIQKYSVGRKILHFLVIFEGLKSYLRQTFAENQRDQSIFAKFISLLTKVLFFARKWRNESSFNPQLFSPQLRPCVISF
jgi:hypothetical protein